MGDLDYSGKGHMELNKQYNHERRNTQFAEKQPPLSVIYGKDPVYMTNILLKTVDLKRYIPKGSSIALKPNLVVANTAKHGATTTPEVVETVVQYLQENGYDNISIIEGSWLAADTMRCFKVCGYADISKKYGVPLVDTKKDSTTPVTVDGYSIDICNSALEADVLINFPVLKGHGQTQLTGALKNLKGIIPDKEKRRFHAEGLHEPIARLNQMYKPTFHIMDGICGDLGFEEGGNPSTMYRMLACEDPVLLDSYQSTLMYLDIDEVPFIRRSHELGCGQLYDPAREEELVLHLNEPETDYSMPKFSRNIPELVSQDLACSSCYGTLFQALLDVDEDLWQRIRQKFEDNSRKPVFFVGQAFKGKEWSSDIPLGIGICTRGAAQSVKGCPPRKEDIIEQINQVF